jgi:hypothetical protein
MKLVNLLWTKWTGLARDTRLFYQQNTRWFVMYMLVAPTIMITILNWVYDTQSRSYIRASMPEEVSDEGYNRWLRKQHRMGRFLDEKLK